MTSAIIGSGSWTSLEMWRTGVLDNDLETRTLMWRLVGVGSGNITFFAKGTFSDCRLSRHHFTMCWFPCSRCCWGLEQPNVCHFIIMVHSDHSHLPLKCLGLSWQLSRCCASAACSSRITRVLHSAGWPFVDKETTLRRTWHVPDGTASSADTVIERDSFRRTQNGDLERRCWCWDSWGNLAHITNKSVWTPPHCVQCETTLTQAVQGATRPLTVEKSTTTGFVQCTELFWALLPVWIIFHWIRWLGGVVTGAYYLKYCVTCITMLVLINSFDSLCILASARLEAHAHGNWSVGLEISFWKWLSSILDRFCWKPSTCIALLHWLAGSSSFCCSIHIEACKSNCSWTLHEAPSPGNSSMVCVITLDHVSKFEWRQGISSFVHFPMAVGGEMQTMHGAGFHLVYLRCIEL